MNSQPVAGPLDHIIHPSQLAAEGLDVEIIATRGERAAIQAALDIEDITHFVAEMVATPVIDGSVAVRGRVRAMVTRTCVVTLKNFDSEIDEEFDELFRLQTNPEAPGRAQVTIDIDDPGDSETFTDDKIDLGNLAFEVLALTLDPYPHAPDAPEVLTSLDQLGLQTLGAKNVTAGTVDEVPKRISPFAALKK